MTADIATYIIQAGGQGSRMEHYTWNKPKCLVPIDGKPLIYHLFDCAPQAHFIVIGDYLFDVLDAYLKTFPPAAKVTLVHSQGKKGTCAGMRVALENVAEPGRPVGVAWCDLLFETLPDYAPNDKPTIGLSTHFPCRWSVTEKGELAEEMSFDRGVAGFFVFPNASFLRNVPEEGEFVRWLKGTFSDFETVALSKCSEVGNSAVAMRHWESRGYARFFNDVRMLDGKVEKRARTPDGDKKLVDEADWYEETARRGFKNIPALLGRSPLTLSRIDGKHPDEINLKPREKFALLERLFESLETLHALGSCAVDADDCAKTYIEKTCQRVRKVFSLIPSGNDPFFVINGRRCRNPFAGEGFLPALVGRIGCDAFRFIHGDPTFANTLVTPEGDVYLLDPRVMFGKTKFFGDPDYDWAKLYYSVIGDYDAFNRRRFRLVVWENTVSLDIESAGFSFTKAMFKERLGESRFRKIELLHALIWLSLAGWVDDDVDSIIAAFYNGLYWLEEWGAH